MPKRKASALDAQPATRQTRSTKTQQTIYTFSSVAKPRVAANEGKKRKTVHTREATPPPAPVLKPATRPANKRKRAATAEESDDDDVIALSSREAISKAPRQPKAASTPRNKRVKNAPAPAEPLTPPATPTPQELPRPQETPSKKAAALFDRLSLADLKAGKLAKVEEAKKAAPEPVAQKAPQSVQHRGTALLDRILAKQSLAASLPAAPTRAQIERTAALQRIEGVARILTLMLGTKERSTFSMQVVIQQLQQSLRTPISQVEVWRCLSLMSTEITPNFVKVVQSGEVQGVVLTRNGSVELSELRAKIQQACA